MRISKSLSLTSRYGLSDLHDDASLALSPEKVFSRTDAAKKLYRKPQALDWFQDSWTYMGETSQSSVEKGLGSPETPGAKLPRVKRSASSRQRSETTPSSTDVAGRIGQLATRRSRSVSQKRDEELDQHQRKAKPTSGLTLERQNRSFRVKKSEGTEKLKRTTSSGNAVLRVSAKANSTDRLDLESFSACDRRSKTSATFTSDTLHSEFTCEGKRLPKTKPSGRKGAVESSESTSTFAIRDIIITPNELNLVAERNKAATAGKGLKSGDIGKSDARKKISSKGSKSEKWKKPIQRQIKSQKSWSDQHEDDPSQQGFDLVSNRLGGNNDLRQSKDTIQTAESDNRQRELDDARRRARDHWKALTERERKLDQVRRNARENWNNLLREEQDHIDFVVAALESTKIPNSYLKPFDWINNEELMNERAVFMAILRNEAALALLGNDYRVPKCLLGDRAVVLEYIQSRNRFHEASEGKAAHVNFVGVHSEDTSAFRLFDKKGNFIRKFTTKSASDGQESASSTAIIANSRDGDSSLSTYHDSDCDSLPKTKK